VTDKSVNECLGLASSPSTYLAARETGRASGGPQRHNVSTKCIELYPELYSVLKSFFLNQNSRVLLDTCITGISHSIRHGYGGLHTVSVIPWC
jgi:hypothetical protein